jgi:hypothetical protein
MGSVAVPMKIRVEHTLYELMPHKTQAIQHNHQNNVLTSLKE